MGSEWCALLQENGKAKTVFLGAESLLPQKQPPPPVPFLVCEIDEAWEGETALGERKAER